MMADKDSSGKKGWQKTRDEIERKVDERTRDLVTANSRLKEEVETRRQVEGELRRNREAALLFSKQLTVLQKITNQLAKVESSDELCRQAVQLGRSHLGFDRVSIWFIEEHLGIMRGSFGTDERGELRDERNAQVEFRHEGLAWRVFSHKESTALVEQLSLYDHLGREVGEGDNAMAALWDGDAVIGIISVDNLFTGQPIREHQLEVLMLYATTLGHLITRKWADEARRASEVRFRTFVDYAADAFFLHDEGGAILDVNLQACKSLGYSHEELIGMTPHDFDAGTDHSFIEQMSAQLAAGEVITFDTLHRRKDGSVIPVEVRTRPLRQGERNLAVSFARDITERKQMEEALRESEQKFRSFVEESSEGFTLSDEQGHIIDWNRARERMTGLKANQVIGKLIWDILHQVMPPERRTPENYESNRKTILDALETGQSPIFNHVIDAEVMKPDGERQFVQQTVFPIKTDKGFRIGSVTSDITKRKKAEMQIYASEQLFRALVENSPDFIARYDREFRRIYVNPAIQKLFGDLTENRLGKTPADQSPVYAPQIYIDHLRQVIETAAESVLETPFRTVEGEMHWGQIRFVPEFGPDNKVASVLAIGRDIHEIKENEQRFRMLAENFPDFVIRFDCDGRYSYVNPAVEEAFGMPAEAIVGKTLQELPQRSDPEQNNALLALIRRAFDDGIPNESEAHWNTGMGERIFEVRHAPEKDAAGNVVSVISIARDITERKHAEEERQAHLWFLESMDKVNRAIQGTNDIKQMMSDVLDIVLSIFDCDRAFLLYPCDPEASSWFSPMERTRPEYPGVLALGIDEVPMDAEVARTFRIILDSDGPVKFGPGISNRLPANVSERFDLKSFMSMALYPKVGKPWQFGIHQCSYARIWTPEDERLFQEIGRRLSDALSTMLTYRNLQESEERYRQLVNTSPDAIIVYNQGSIVFVNPASVWISGAKSEDDLVGRSVLEFVQPDYRENVTKGLEHIQRTGESALFVEENFLRVDGTKLNMEVTIVPYQFQGEDYIQFIVRDITERKQHEREREAIITVSTALRQATTRTEIFSVILDQLVDLFDADGAVMKLPNPQTGGFIVEMGRGVVGERMIGLNIPPGKGVCNWVITNKKSYLNNYVEDDLLFYRPDLFGDSHSLIAAPLIAQEQAIGALWVARRMDFVEQDLLLLTAIADIAANAIRRVTLYEQTEQQLHRLIALHQIDLAISTNFDLNITLKVILRNVKDELEVDAVSILLLNPVTHTLDYAAGLGFRTHNIEQSHVKLGNGCAGRAAQERRTVSCVNLRRTPESSSRSSFLAGEEFESHYTTPLVVKGQVKGVLEFFHRKTLKPEQITWLSYFETLATQAAIAIENASLFENLQRSNMELTLAYDATIEGWSRALDLRDKETEGHTQRVTEMALELAEKMGMSAAEKLDFRRGALLHDIGKMGVPDAILLKPGPLSDEEWEIMRQHPLFAYQMLAPIAYLKHALEIPYCHHEKWDGSGYPRGLKGKQIPLAARIFAVVDVLDAVTSNRPYRSAWSKEDAVEYIREQAGKHFDPQVVELFLQEMKAEI